MKRIAELEQEYFVSSSKLGNNVEELRNDVIQK